MTKRPWVASLISISTSKRVVVAVVAATALVLGVMSVGAAVLIQKKISGIADVQGAPYTPPQHPGSRHTAENTAPAVASAGTGPASSRAGSKRVAGASVQDVPAAAPSHSPAPGVPLVPPANDNVVHPPAADVLPPDAAPFAPLTDMAPPAPGPNLQPLQPARQLTDPLADLLSLPVRIQMPILGIGLGL